MPGLPSTSDTNTLSFPPSNWLLILMNVSGWDFLWLLNEASAIWPLTLEPRNSILTEQPRVCVSNHANLTATANVKKLNRVRVVWTTPPTSPASPLILWQELQTENGVTPGAQLKQALQRKLLTVVQKGQSQIPAEKPHRGLLNRDTTGGLESTTCKSQKDFREESQHACPDVCYLLERENLRSIPVWTCVLLQDQRDNINSLLLAQENSFPSAGERWPIPSVNCSKD